VYRPLGRLLLRLGFDAAFGEQLPVQRVADAAVDVLDGAQTYVGVT